MITWRWPQYIMAAIYLIQLGIHLALNGEPMRGEYNFIEALIITAIAFVILRAGGFF